MEKELRKKNEEGEGEGVGCDKIDQKRSKRSL
jgi:hypothetical protein